MGEGNALTMTMVGTKLYCAPEIMTGNRYNESVASAEWATHRSSSSGGGSSVSLLRLFNKKKHSSPTAATSCRHHVAPQQPRCYHNAMHGTLRCATVEGRSRLRSSRVMRVTIIRGISATAVCCVRLASRACCAARVMCGGAHNMPAVLCSERTT